MEVQEQINEIKTRVNDLHKKSEDTNLKVNQIYDALIGTKLMPNEGLVQRVKIIEDRQKQFETDLDKIAKKNIKLEVYQKVMWLMGGTVLSGTFMYILQLIFHNK